MARTALRGPGRARPGAALFALLLALLLALAGCSGSGGDDDRDDASGRQAAPRYSAGSEDRAVPDAAPTEAEAEAGADQKAPQDSSRPKQPVVDTTHVIRTATLSIRTGNLTRAVGRAQQVATTLGGYVGTENTDTDDVEAHSRLVLRVPADSYDEALEQLAAIGDARGNELVNRSVSTEDVTDQMVDTESRLKSQRASVDRIRRLMDDATSIADVVALESELTNRQADLDSYQRQLASLRDRTTLATVTVEFTEPVADGPEKKDDDESIGEAVTDALDGGWDALVVAVRALLVALAAVAPFAGVAVVLWLVWRLLGRRWVRSRAGRRASGAVLTAPAGAVGAGPGGAGPVGAVRAPVPPPLRAPGAAGTSAGAAGEPDASGGAMGVGGAAGGAGGSGGAVAGGDGEPGGAGEPGAR